MESVWRANRSLYLGFGGERRIEPSGGWFLRSVSQNNWSLTASSGKANDWRNREHVVLDLFSNWKCVRFKGFFGEPLGSSENPTWANFGKQNWRWHPPSSPCVRPKRPHVDVQTPPVCTSKTSPCVPAPHAHVFQHVRVVPVHTGTSWMYTRGFSACHTTLHAHTTTTTTYTTQHGNITRRQGQRETESDRERQRETERDRERQRETERDKTKEKRQDKTRRQEKMKVERHKTREKKREERRWNTREEKIKTREERREMMKKKREDERGNEREDEREERREKMRERIKASRENDER